MNESEILFEKSYTIQGEDFNRAGDVSTDLKKTLTELGINPAIIRRIVISTFEAEMNITMYATEGSLLLKVYEDRIQVILDDRGPGIPDIDLAMQEGYSTATAKMREMGFGAGMGLPNMKKNSDLFHIDSTVNVGTKIEIVVHLN